MSKQDLIQQARIANRYVLRALREGLPRVAQLYRDDRNAFIESARTA